LLSPKTNWYPGNQKREQKVFFSPKKNLTCSGEGDFLSKFRAEVALPSPEGLRSWSKLPWLKGHLSLYRLHPCPGAGPDRFPLDPRSFEKQSSCVRWSRATSGFFRSTHCPKDFGSQFLAAKGDVGLPVLPGWEAGPDVHPVIREEPTVTKSVSLIDTDPPLLGFFFLIINFLLFQPINSIDALGTPRGRMLLSPGHRGEN
jgi:hypothetical protein